MYWSVLDCICLPGYSYVEQVITKTQLHRTLPVFWHSVEGKCWGPQGPVQRSEVPVCNAKPSHHLRKRRLLPGLSKSVQNNGLLGYFQRFWAIILHTFRVQVAVNPGVVALHAFLFKLVDNWRFHVDPGCCKQVKFLPHLHH